MTGVEIPTGYTPGPWKTEAARHRPDSYVSISGSGWSQIADVVVEFYGEAENNPEALANLSLILAAPAMAEELVALRSQNDALMHERASMIATHRENRALAEKRHAAELAALRARVAEMEAVAPMSARLSPEYEQGYWAGFAHGERTTLRKLLRRGVLELFQANVCLSEPRP